MNIEKIIEFDKIKEMWMELAVTDKAREQIANTSYLLEENELKKCLKDTTNSRKFIEKCGTPPFFAFLSLPYIPFSLFYLKYPPLHMQ